MHSVVEKIKEYYEKRKLTKPNFDNAMKFVQTEIAEVYELDLDRSGDWVRNNPQNKPQFNKEDLAEELGDAIMMLIVAGIAEDVDPIQALLDKMERKLGQSKIAGTSELRIMSDQEIEEVNRKLRDTSPAAFYEEDDYDYIQDDFNFDAARERSMRR